MSGAPGAGIPDGQNPECMEQGGIPFRFGGRYRFYR